jgi:hypothetical protein
MSPLYLAATVALILGALELVCRWVAHMPNPADAQPDFTPPDDPDPVDAADDTRDGADLAPECLDRRHVVNHPGLACWEFDELRKQLFAGPPPWMAERLIEETETYLQEQVK